MSKLLFIDDDTDLLQINAKYFTKENYEVFTCSDSTNALKIIDDIKPDCIILDVMMPNINGPSLCKTIRKHNNAPIIFLSGISEENDKISALLIGGDDYITKPFSYKELSARINVQLRRYNSSHPAPINSIDLSNVHLDLTSHQAFIDEHPLHLSNREFTLLQLMMSTPNEVVTFEEIGKTIWQYYSDSERQTIMVIASRLRKKLLDLSGKDNFIETIRSKGYKFIAK